MKRSHSVDADRQKPINPKKKSRKQKESKAGPVSNADDTLPASIDEWQWSEIAPGEMLQDMGGFLSLEEIDGVDVVEEGGAFSFRPAKAKKNKNGGKDRPGKASPYSPLPEKLTKKFIAVDDFDESEAADASNVEKDETKEDDEDDKNSVDGEDEDVKEKDSENEEVDDAPDALNQDELLETSPDPNDADMSAWTPFSLPAPILADLQTLKFTSPTPIQSSVLPHALKGRDIIGAAETGSGKTLAFALPILAHVYRTRMANKHNPGAGAKPSSSSTPRPPTALILTPTRELATQIADHLRSAGSNLLVRVACVIGGMSVHKQRRLLQRGADVVVATVGRLWEVMEDDPAVAGALRKVAFLVVDEGDRMVEVGHYKELDLILRAINGKTPDGAGEKEVRQRKTFVFSATMHRELAKKRKKGKGDWDSVLAKLSFQDPLGPLRVDLTRDNFVSSGLSEGRIECEASQKDTYLLYLLLRHPSRTLVFFSSLPSLKRVASLLQHILPNLPTPRTLITLHGHMQQRERLKHVEKFARVEGAVMVATDVAARGLDVPGVEMVVQYGVPKDPAVYVHRSGRTARAGEKGAAIVFVCPEDNKAYRGICDSLKKKSGIEPFPVDASLLPAFSKRVELARSIDGVEHGESKEKTEKLWMKKMAREADIALDSDDSSDDETHHKATKSKTKNPASAAAKRDLLALLKVPILPSKLRGGFITSEVNLAVGGVDDTEGGTSADVVQKLREGLKSGEILPTKSRLTAHKLVKTQS
ncbi:P-loop containing nucleoside triphosphate hydrolase protein [Gonapodya prolifera JEL478]|uniref:RNA helicase n=1 Tax=Gonapodya prolifera (strain JEL478) TaxID=1344416 RepID=A0A139A9F3_GONPJ|nr:P-loop containing nucleoside triphosphate hydrolase protein [Gonapodya prolifera JEL478]|eukprot:KXS13430.1 P-loop containing nucleoside triphosphate hydrolase protein [Gonapodya prolifera JEL478]